jgi:hypothetical protein
VSEAEILAYLERKEQEYYTKCKETRDPLIGAGYGLVCAELGLLRTMILKAREEQEASDAGGV